MNTPDVDLPEAAVNRVSRVPEMVEHILSSLSTRDLLAAQGVCRNWKQPSMVASRCSVLYASCQKSTQSCGSFSPEIQAESLERRR